MEDDLYVKRTGAKETEDKDVTEEAKESLRRQVEELKRLNAALLAENDMYEHFISRLDPHELLSVEDQKTKGGGRRLRQKSQPEQQLTLQQKCYVAQSEIMEMQKEQEKFRHRYEKKQEDFRDSMKEAEIRLEDIRRAKADFERRLLKPLREKRLDIHKPEKVLQFIQDKSKLNQMEKCSLKTQSMQAFEKRLQQQLQQRKDLGKADYEDFFQDVNEQHHDIDLDEVRVNNIKTQHVLSSYKEKLQRAKSELSNLHKVIKAKEHKLARLEETIQSVEEERLKAQILNDDLQCQVAGFKAPDTTEYMLMKEKHRKLQQSILMWERKAGVAEMALKSSSKTWAKQRATITPVNSAATRARSGGQQFSLKLPDIAEHKEISLSQYINV
ncbi:cilia- and flagella-associated protein 263-like [Eucyclogobius newberryi]|uniref:cilia- and flagella-associated protein 263-like n=1 Tax=Eucyclogobius newberryi TaxID=166745 RepID=UPI003B5BF9DB